MPLFFLYCIVSLISEIMNSIRSIISSWFGYDRRERRATLVVVVLIAVVTLIRFAPPSGKELPVALTFEEKAPGLAAEPYGSSTSESVRAQPVRSSPVPRRQSTINLNLCDSAELDRLPGIGPVLSARIIKYRNLLGGYADKSQLLEVYGLRDSVFNIISSRVEADTLRLTRIQVNSAGFSDLLRHPYLEIEHVKSIVQYREKHGSISGWAVMLENSLVPEGKAHLLRYYLSF